MGSVILAILALCTLIVIHEFGHYIVARWCNMRVEKFSIGFGPALWSKKIGETVYQISPFLLGGYVQIAGSNPEDVDSQYDPQDPRLYSNRKPWQRFLVVMAGPFINYLFAFLVVFGLNVSLGVLVEKEGVSIGEVKQDFPAAFAGLKENDQVLSVNGIPMKTPKDFFEYVSNSKGNTLSFEVLRNQKTRFTVQVVPRMEDGVPKVGIIPQNVMIRKHIGIGESLYQAIVFPVRFTWIQLQGFGRLFYDSQARDGMGGPVKIITEMKKQMRLGIAEALSVMAIVSAALGFFNFLPFPALDGGRLIFLGWEIITRRPASKKVEQIVHTIGIILLLILIVLMTFRDVWQLIKGLF